MTYRTIILRRARQDIARIHGWIAKRSPTGAERWFQALEDAIELLRRDAAAYPLTDEAAHVGMAIRHVLFHTRRGNKYRVVFIIFGDEVRVLRVRGTGQRRLRSRDVI